MQNGLDGRHMFRTHGGRQLAFGIDRGRVQGGSSQRPRSSTAARPLGRSRYQSILAFPLLAAHPRASDSALSMIEGAPSPEQEVERLTRLFRELVEANASLERENAELRRAAQALRERELESGLMIDGIPGFVATLSPDGNVEAVNRGIVEYTGHPLEELRHWGTNGIVHPDDMPHVAAIFVRSISAGIAYEIEQRLRRHDGAYRWFNNRGIPARDAAGNIVRWYVLLVDVDDRKRAEDALGELRSELARIARISSLGLLTASVAHEVSQPLSGIITNASACLRMLGASPPNVEGAIETARRTLRDGSRASEVVARLRALFMKRTDKNVAVDVHEALSEVLALASSDLQRNRVLLRLERAGALPQVRADRVQLQQVILNLLLNATDAMSGVDDRERVLVISTALDGDSVKLCVKDAGIGFAAEDAERLFEAFYTTKSRGMGVGLSVSRSIIESLDGRLWGEPNDGPGATFSFSVPVAPEASPLSARSA
jgi:PAS domain S-box-containing protein